MQWRHLRKLRPRIRRPGLGPFSLPWLLGLLWLLAASWSYGDSGRIVSITVVALEPGVSQPEPGVSQPNELVAVLRLEAVQSSQADYPLVIERELALPWSGSLSLPRQVSIWRASVQAKGYWVPDVLLTEQDSKASFQMVATGRLEGTLKTPQKEQLGRTRIVLSATNSKGAPTSQDLEFECFAEQAAFSCGLPSGSWHLRFEVTEYVPHYLWDLQISPESPAVLGQLTLEKGASLAGWVESPLSQEAPPAEIALRPEVYGFHRQTEGQGRLRHQARKMKVDPRGFFQFTGISPGAYSLTASQPGLAPRSLEGLVIDQAAELKLDESIVLEPPLILEVFVEPPLDGYGEPWKVGLSQLDMKRGLIKMLASSNASLSGQWSSEGLAAGSYQLEIQDSLAASWHSQGVEVLAEAPPLFIELDAVAVRGRILSGGEPLTTNIVFGTPFRLPNVTLRADEEGHFSGYLPHEGTWPVALQDDDEGSNLQNLEPVEVSKRPGKTYAEVNIELPDTVVSGRVEEDGQPVHRALVFIYDQEHQEQNEGDLKTRADGTFELRGMQPSQVALIARHGEKSSEWVYSRVEEGIEGDQILLELRDRAKISGRVVSGGRGIPGVEILAWPVSGDFLPDERRVSTGADGEFNFDVPQTAHAVDLLIGAPGFGVQLRRLAPDPDIIISLDQMTGQIDLAYNGDPRDYTLSSGGATMPMDVVWRQLRRWNRTSVGSFYSLQGWSPGDYRLCPKTKVGGDACMSGQLLPQSDLYLTTVAATSNAPL